jgi:hypothetical protein
LGEFEGPLRQHHSTQGGGLVLHTYALADRFIEFEIGSFSAWLHQLDYSARLHLALQRRCTAAADLDDPVQLQLVPQYLHTAAMSSTTLTS